MTYCGFSEEPIGDDKFMREAGSVFLKEDLTNMLLSDNFQDQAIAVETWRFLRHDLKQHSSWNEDFMGPILAAMDRTVYGQQADYEAPARDGP